MGIWLYIKLMQCNGFPEIYAQLEGVTSNRGICAFYDM